MNKENTLEIVKDIVIYGIIILTIGIGIFLFTSHVKNYYLAKRSYDELQEEYIKEPEKEEENAEREIDLNALKEINAEIVGWMNIEGTRVDYPVVKTNDNETYLTKNFQKEDSISGCLFMDCRNDGRWTSLVTIVYGHNMKDGSMFGSLKKYTSYDYYKAHPVIKLYTFYGIKEYAIISAFITDKNDPVYQFEITGTKEYDTYLKDIKSKVHYDTPDYDINKRTLILSTCHGKENRFILVAQEK